jgi:xanthine dehydrogenase FAD-binding subunit
VLTRFDYHRPGSERELGKLLPGLKGQTTLLAGGTDVLVQMRNGRIKPAHVVDLVGIREWRSVEITPDGGLEIGATATVSALVTHPYPGRHYEAIVEGGRAVGSAQIQNRATLAGNVCNASPAADTVPPLLVFDAVVRVAGLSGRRSVPLRGFLRGPGQTALRDGEWVEGIRVPPAGPAGSCYLKLGRTRGVDLAVVGVACRVSATSASMSLASVAPTALHVDIARLQSPELEELEEPTLRMIRSLLRPIDDARGSAIYRTAMALVLARRAWRLSRRRFATAKEVL